MRQCAFLPATRNFKTRQRFCKRHGHIRHRSRRGFAPFLGSSILQPNRADRSVSLENFAYIDKVGGYRAWGVELNRHRVGMVSTLVVRRDVGAEDGSFYEDRPALIRTATCALRLGGRWGSSKARSAAMLRVRCADGGPCANRFGMLRQLKIEERSGRYGPWHPCRPRSASCRSLHRPMSPFQTTRGTVAHSGHRSGVARRS